MVKPILKKKSYEGVWLRYLQKSDLELTFSWRNKEEIRKWFHNSTEISPLDHLNWFNKYQEMEDDLVFIIMVGSTPVGQISLYHIDYINKRAEYGRIMIGDMTQMHKGIARKASVLLLDIAFNELDLDEVYLEVKANNQNAISLYLALGFQITMNEFEIISMRLKKISNNCFDNNFSP